MSENGIFGEESGKERNSSNGNSTHKKSGIGEGKVFSQPSHLSHIQLSRESMHHASSRKKKEALKKSMGIKVEHSCSIGSDPASYKHISYLGYGGIGKNPFYVILGQGHRGRIDSCQGTDNGYNLCSHS